MHVAPEYSRRGIKINTCQRHLSTGLDHQVVTAAKVGDQPWCPHMNIEHMNIEHMNIEHMNMEHMNMEHMDIESGVCAHNGALFSSKEENQFIYREMGVK